MRRLAGTDEAGYGPNLGPLVVSASVWEAPADALPEQLFARLAGAVAPSLAVAAAAGPGVVALADSKALYSPGKGLAALERGVLAALGTLGRRPTSWRRAWDALVPNAAELLAACPWIDGYDEPVPVACAAEDVERGAAALCAEFACAGVRLVALESRAVFEAEFNALLDRHDSKGAVLSHVTLDLAARALAAAGGGPAVVVCDKHGGRGSYAPLLTEHFDAFVEVRGEGRQRSAYRFGPPERRIEFRFEARGETNLPTALASMASKYLRELAMRALNAFWARRVPGLAPTAGYPADAQRFQRDIAAAQRELGLDDAAVWRRK